MLVKDSPDMVIGRTWRETQDLNWGDCYPVIDLFDDATDGIIIDVYTRDDIDDPNFTPVEMRGGRFVRMTPDEVENGNPDAFIRRA